MNDQCFSSSVHRTRSSEAHALSEYDSSLLASSGFRLRPRDGTAPGEPYVAEFAGGRSLHFDHYEVQSEMKLSDPFALQFEYTRLMMGFLLFNPEPRIVDMIGLGGGSLAKYCYHMVPSSIITVVDTSPEVIALRDRFLIPEECKRFSVRCGDGADFVRGNGPGPDALLVDGFDKDGQPPQLCSAGFYDDCYRRLAPGGLLVANLWEKRRLCISRLRAAFGDEILVLRTRGSSNRVVFARKGAALSPDSDLAELQRLHPSFMPQVAKRVAKAIAHRELIARVKAALSLAASRRPVTQL